MLEINKIYLGDCMDYMKQIPDKSIDLVLTDPPYGIGIGKRATIRGGSPFGGGGQHKATAIKPRFYGLTEWDNKVPDRKYFDEIIRISKNQIIFGGNYFVEYLRNSPYWIVWYKEQTCNFADCELIWTSFDSAVQFIRYRWNGLLQQDMAHKDIRVHPTQKPVKLIMKILKDYSKCGDLISDPFLGSGTTAVACLKTNRNFIGMEKEKKYYEIALERIEKAKNKSLDDFVWKDEQVI